MTSFFYFFFPSVGQNPLFVSKHSQVLYVPSLWTLIIMQHKAEPPRLTSKLKHIGVVSTDNPPFPFSVRKIPLQLICILRSHMTHQCTYETQNGSLCLNLLCLNLCTSRFFLTSEKTYIRI